MNKRVTIFLILSLGFQLRSQAQIYRGGDGGGNAQVLISNLTLSAPIYLGNNGSGNSVATRTNTSLGTQIFRGGNNDGYSTISGSGQTNESIFLGSDSDGFASSLIVGQSFSDEIYKGGNEDGNVVNSISNQIVNEIIFLGGNDDGMSFGVLPTSTLNENIFLGASGRGESMILRTNRSLGSRIFLGGQNDGFSASTGFNLSTARIKNSSINLTGNWIESNVLLSWGYISESKKDLFEIQRSIDGNEFISVGGASTADVNSTGEFEYLDKAPLTTKDSPLYYRIKVTDNDLQTSFSNTIVLSLHSILTPFISVFPNPASSEFNIVVSSKVPFENNVEAGVYDLTGRLVTRVIFNKSISMDVSKLASGVYYIVATNPSGGGSISIKVLINH